MGRSCLNSHNLLAIQRRQTNVYIKIKLEEAIKLIDSYPEATVNLVEINADGCTFEGDSRSYIYHALQKMGYADKVKVTKIHNGKDEMFLRDLDNLYIKIMRG